MAEPSAGSRRRGLLRTTWLAAGVAVVGTPGTPCRCCARSRCSGSGRATARRTSRSTRARSPRSVTAPALARRTGCTVSNGDSKRHLTRAICRRCRRRPRPCRSRASRAGAHRRTGPECGSATCWRSSASTDDVDVVVRVAAARRALPGHRAAARTSSDDDDTLLALELNGEALSIDHGFPCRLIAPDRPGVLQTKWVARLEVA